MEFMDTLVFIVGRAMALSMDMATPLTVLFYIVFIGALCAAMLGLERRLASFLATVAAVVLFFVIWNHPGYSWYKSRPWAGGYVYAAIMVVVYALLPATVLRLGSMLAIMLRGGETSRFWSGSGKSAGLGVRSAGSPGAGAVHDRPRPQREAEEAETASKKAWNGLDVVRPEPEEGGEAESLKDKGK